MEAKNQPNNLDWFLHFIYTTGYYFSLFLALDAPSVPG